MAFRPIITREGSYLYYKVNYSIILKEKSISKGGMLSRASVDRSEGFFPSAVERSKKSV